MLKSVEIRNKLNAKLEEVEKIANTASKEDLAKNTAEIKDLMAQLEVAETIENAERTVKGGVKLNTGNKSKVAKTLGEHFVNSAKTQIENRGQQYNIEASEFKNAATDPHLTTDGDGQFKPALTEVDMTIVQQHVEPTIYNLFSQSTMSGQSITYFVQTGTQARKGTTAEGAKKNQRNFTYESKTDALSKVTGFIKVSEETMEDLPQVADDINNRLLVEVDLDKQYQLINGAGAGTDLVGVLNRPGIQTETSTSADDNADAIFRAMTKINTKTGRISDAIVINPTDYQTLRLKKDANGQYLGGGFFQGQYGQGAVDIGQAIWGRRTIVSSAVDVGTALVGAFQQGGTVYTKGGKRVAASNSNEDDFVKNMVTIRAEERIALAVRIPEAFVKVTLSAAPAGV